MLPSSAVESAFVLRALSEGLRLDGRRSRDARTLRVQCSEREGCVEVRLGDTKAMGVVTAELVEPYVDRPTEGQLLFFVELSPMVSPTFETGRPSEHAIELMRLLERGIRKSQAIDVEALCAVAGKRVWSVRTDVTVLDDRGNVADAVCAAALGALMSFRLPAVSITGSGDEATVKALRREQADPVALVFHHLPICVTLGLFRVGDAGPAVLVLDPTDREEMVLVGRVAVVLNQFGEVCAMQKLGGLPAMPDQMLECVRQAAGVAPTFLASLHAAMNAFARQAEERALHLAKTGRMPKRNAARSDQAIVSTAGGAANGIGCAAAAPMAVEPMAVDEHMPVAADAPSAVTAGEVGDGKVGDGSGAAAGAPGVMGSLGDSDEEETRTLTSPFDQGSLASAADGVGGTPTARVPKAAPTKLPIQKSKTKGGRGAKRR
jgi:exosome complex component RRP45